MAVWTENVLNAQAYCRTIKKNQSHLFSEILHLFGIKGNFRDIDKDVSNNPI